MRKPMPPELLALAPNGIENLILRCVICGESLPSSRRTVGDHAGACHKLRVLYRRFVISQTKCIACLHPSTPEERDQFREWRRERGDVRRHNGRPKKPLTSDPGSDQAETGASNSALPDKASKKAQPMVSKNDAIGLQQSDDLCSGDGLAPSVEIEPCIATPIEQRD